MQYKYRSQSEQDIIDICIKNRAQQEHNDIVGESEVGTMDNSL
jgi:hypothetical protein